MSSFCWRFPSFSQFPKSGRERETEKELPGFKLLDQKEKASQNAPLALEDAKSEMPASQAAAQPEEETKHPQALIASLQSGIVKSKDGSQSSVKNPVSKVGKRPAARSSGLKRPAAAVSKTSQADMSVKKSGLSGQPEKKTRLAAEDMLAQLVPLCLGRCPSSCKTSFEVVAALVETDPGAP